MYNKITVLSITIICLLKTLLSERSMSLSLSLSFLNLNDAAEEIAVPSSRTL